jgi:flagellar biosynthesis protein FliQ
MPMFLVLAAVAVEILFWRSRTRDLDARKVLLLTGAVTGLIVAVTLPVQQVLVDPTASFGPAIFAILVVVGLPFGLLAGFLAARFITMLRALAPAAQEA